jgi:hypothetical protein
MCETSKSEDVARRKEAFPPESRELFSKAQGENIQMGVFRARNSGTVQLFSRRARYDASFRQDGCATQSPLPIQIAAIVYSGTFDGGGRLAIIMQRQRKAYEDDQRI